MLAAIGKHAIEVAYAAEKALRMAADFEPGLILLDIGLPGIDGFEVARRLRTNRCRRDTKLVALTGYGSDDDRRKCLDAGFDLHLVKPIGVEDLLKLLGSAAGNRGSS